MANARDALWPELAGGSTGCGVAGPEAAAVVLCMPLVKLELRLVRDLYDRVVV